MRPSFAQYQIYAKKHNWEWFNYTAIASAPCPVQTLIKQMNVGMAPKAPFTVFEFQTSTFKNLVKVTLITSVTEEILCRWLLQDRCLKALPKWLVKKFAPDKETLLDHRTAQIIRVALTATIFTVVHLTNCPLMKDPFTCTPHLVNAFFKGLLFGALKESNLGLLGAIGAHMSNNITAEEGVFVLLNC